MILAQDELTWFNGASPEFSSEGLGIEPGITYHVAAVVEESPGVRQVTLYVNGEVVATKLDPDKIVIDVGGDLRIGAFGGNLPFSGVIDDLQLYDRALSPENLAFLATNPGEVIDSSDFLAAELGFIEGVPEDADAPGLQGSYWSVPAGSVPISGNPMHRSGYADEFVFNTVPTGIFASATSNYGGGGDLSPIRDWLGNDGVSYMGATGNLEDSVIRFEGYLYVDKPGIRTFTLNSDDGSVLYIGDRLAVEYDNRHARAPVDIEGELYFPSAGYYPIDLRYYNADDSTGNGGANLFVTGLEDAVQSIDIIFNETALEIFITRTDSGNVMITLPEGATYDIEYSKTLEPGSWTLIQMDVRGSYEDTELKRAGFYRGVK